MCPLSRICERALTFAFASSLASISTFARSKTGTEFLATLTSDRVTESRQTFCRPLVPYLPWSFVIFLLPFTWLVLHPAASKLAMSLP
ncbi:hypothetical protein N7522_011093 [Penicillium canescens]|uniref:Uncharacterized protein n=1 Tax=Penicillium canescens TaxID=5083 RepID=A0AAD6NCW6_PENCN|nr:uncharacterized protein N7446_006686 [Penicillium canescens]KAJ5990886.1 hypothetical protein N7522_011093 [Penicillium canescens]KAJ6049985.1 hypothetical protein N7444_006701 [Penicillium canescens]KAJ6052046.1 hypothetical protein N7460_002580 [Penicillium canescens]KAJ6062566.1 hypothetical protein N7446_006686 [Penicillium canescens]